MMKLKTIGWCCVVPVIWELLIISELGWEYLEYHYGAVGAIALFLQPLLLFFISLPIAKYIIRKQREREQKQEEQMEREQKQRKLAEEQKRAALEEAYAEISDIWDYRDKTMLAVTSSSSEELGYISYVKLKHTNSKSTPWTISLNTALSEGVGALGDEFKAKKSGNSLVGVNGDQIAIMSKGKLTIGDNVLYFDLENNHVKRVKGLIAQMLSKKKMEMVRLEHLEAGADVIDALPKFHFSFNKNGIMCDEINYPKKHLEDFFNKNNGGEHLFQNKIFYEDYCKNKGLYPFDAFQEVEFKRYMSELGMRALKSGYSCKTDFELTEWQVSIDCGIENLFKSFRTYVDNKTLDVVPYAFNEDSILFKHKLYAPKKNKSMVLRDMAIALMLESRADEEPIYTISKIDDGRIFININGEHFVSIENELSRKS